MEEEKNGSGVPGIRLRPVPSSSLSDDVLERAQTQRKNEGAVIYGDDALTKEERRLREEGRMEHMFQEVGEGGHVPKNVRDLKPGEKNSLIVGLVRGGYENEARQLIAQFKDEVSIREDAFPLIDKLPNKSEELVEAAEDPEEEATPPAEQRETQTSAPSTKEGGGVWSTFRGWRRGR